MKTYYVLTLCMTLVIGEVFMTGSPDARETADEKMSNHARGGEIFGQQGRAPEMHQHDQGSLNNHSHNGKVPVSVPDPSTLLLLGSSFVGLVVWYFRKRENRYGITCLSRKP